MKQRYPIKIGISGLRGIVGKTLSPEIAIQFTRAFCTLIQKGRIALARDTRPSGAMLARAVRAGALFNGIPVVDAGILPTPTLQYFVRERQLAGGIMITASHNSEEWNGLKFIDQKGLFLSPHAAQNLIDIYHQGIFPEPSRNEFPGIESEADPFRSHSKKILGIVDGDTIRKKHFRVLVDPGGGVGSLYDLPFLQELGCEVECINDRIQASFPRPPEPLPENLKAVSAGMAGGGFDLGFAQDPDGDRLCLIDEKGAVLGGDITLALALRGFLQLRPGGTVVINLSTSRSVADALRDTGVRISRSPVGEINVVEQMLREDACAGGEGNGGVIIPVVHPCRDSFTGMALILSLLAADSRPLSVIAAGIPRYTMHTLKIPASTSRALRIVSALKEEFPEGDIRDGLWVERPDFWFHVRPSNTEPILRVVAEGTEKKAREIIDYLKTKIASLEES